LSHSGITIRDKLYTMVFQKGVGVQQKPVFYAVVIGCGYVRSCGIAQRGEVGNGRQDSRSRRAMKGTKENGHRLQANGLRIVCNTTTEVYMIAVQAITQELPYS